MPRCGYAAYRSVNSLPLVLAEGSLPLAADQEKGNQLSELGVTHHDDGSLVIFAYGRVIRLGKADAEKLTDMLTRTRVETIVAKLVGLE